MTLQRHPENTHVKHGPVRTRAEGAALAAVTLQPAPPHQPLGQPLKRTPVRPARGHRRRPDPLWARLASDGVRPLFLGGDLLACALTWFVRPTDPSFAAVFTVLLLVVFAQSGLYRSRLALLLLDDAPKILIGWVVAVAVVVAGTQLFAGRFADLHWLALALVGVVLVRGLTYALVRVLRSRGAVSHGTLIVGAGSTSRVLADLLRQHPESGLRLLGHLDLEAESPTSDRAPLLGRPADVAAVLESVQPRVLIVADALVPEEQLVELVRACHRQRCELFVIPRMYEVQQVDKDMDFIGDIPLVRLRRAAHRSGAWRFKRIFDAVFAALALVVLSPLFLACAIAVRLEGGKGVIFRQERVGCDGQLFWVMKFRSLRPVDETESQTQWNIAHDNRLGPVGKFLRKSSIDELPQLFNILVGDMSFVGPRPERPHFVEQFDLLYRGYNARHRVPSGLTGWAQVHGLRGNTSIDERARFDNFYIENWSLWLDFKILLRTAISVFKSPGA